MFSIILSLLVSFSIHADQVSSKFLSSSAVSTAKMADGSISTVKIADSAVTQAKHSHPHYSARVTCGSTGSAVVTQYPSWISSMTNGSTGACTLNITASIFAAAPACATVVFNASAGSNWQFAQITSVSTSAIGLFRAFNATAANGDLMIVCQASR